MATAESPLVVGVFPDRASAEWAAEQLRRAGFALGRLGLVVPDDRGGADAIERAEEGAAAGLLAGGVAGGLLGAAVTGLIPGVGPVLAVGHMAGVLTGAGV